MDSGRHVRPASKSGKVEIEKGGAADVIKVANDQPGLGKKDGVASKTIEPRGHSVAPLRKGDQGQVKTLAIGSRGLGPSLMRKLGRQRGRSSELWGRRSDIK
jgi:hypothetical protein